MRRPKYPKNLKLRKQLIEYLADQGYSIFSVKLRIGYAFSKHEKRKVELGLLSPFEVLLLNSDIWRKALVEGLIEGMKEEGRRN